MQEEGGKRRSTLEKAYTQVDLVAHVDESTEAVGFLLSGFELVCARAPFVIFLDDSHKVVNLSSSSVARGLID